MHPATSSPPARPGLLARLAAFILLAVSLWFVFVLWAYPRYTPPPPGAALQTRTPIVFSAADRARFIALENQRKAAWADETSARCNGENWREFYWAKRLPPVDLTVACMVDRKLIVAPRSLGEPDGIRDKYFYQIYIFSFKLPRPSDQPGMAGPKRYHDNVLIRFKEKGNTEDLADILRKLLESSPDTPRLRFPAQGFEGIISSHGGLIAWPASVPIDRVLAERGPFLLAIPEGDHVRGNITYSDDNTSTALARFDPFTVPADFDHLGLYKQLKSISSKLRSKG